MIRQRQPRTTDPKYLAWLRKQRCACGCLKGPPCDAAHLRAGSVEYDKRHVGIGEKPDDRWALPLTHACHMQQHDFGNEVEWWIDVKLKDPFAEAIKHYRRFKREQRSKK
jgi:hypothetical protein